MTSRLPVESPTRDAPMRSAIAPSRTFNASSRNEQESCKKCDGNNPFSGPRLIPTLTNKAVRNPSTKWLAEAEDQIGSDAVMPALMRVKWRTVTK